MEVKKDGSKVEGSKEGKKPGRKEERMKEKRGMKIEWQEDGKARRKVEKKGRERKGREAKRRRETECNAFLIFLLKLKDLTSEIYSFFSSDRRYSQKENIDENDKIVLRVTESANEKKIILIGD